MRIPHSVVPRTGAGGGAALGYQSIQGGGGGLQGFAQGLNSLGVGLDQYAAAQKQTQRFGTLTDFSNFQTEMAAQLEKAKREAPANGANFAETAEGVYTNAANKFVSERVPGELQPEFALRATELKNRVLANALDFEYKQKDAYYRQGVGDLYEKAKISVSQDPALLESQHAAMVEAINATDLPAVDKADLIRKTQIGLAGIKYKSAVKKNLQENAGLGVGSEATGLPAQLADEIGPEYGVDPSYLKKVAWIESRGKSDPPHNSSARGVYQFMPGTAKDYNLTNPLDPRASTIAAAQLTRDNKAALTKALGREPTDGELYLAHQQGAGGAIALLKNPNQSAANVVGIDAVVQNGGRPDLTAGEFAALWTRKLDGAEPDFDKSLDNDPTYAGLAYEDRLALRDDARAEVNRDITERKKQETESHNIFLNSLYNGLADGTLGPSAIDAARASGQLVDYDEIKKARGVLDDLGTKIGAQRSALEKLGTPGSIWNPSDADDRKRMNALFSPEAMGQRDSGYVMNSLVPLVEKTNDIPTNAVGTLQSLRRSSNMQDVEFAYQTMAQLEQANPGAFDQRFTEADQKDLDFWRMRKDYLPHDQLIQMLNDAHDPQVSQRLELVRAEGEKYLKANPLTAQEVTNKIDPGAVGGLFNGSMPGSAMVQAALTQDYRTAWLDAYSRTGDPDFADASATKTIGRSWGRTSVGDGALMQFPPEKVGYKPINGSYNWIDSQLREELKLPAGTNFQLVSDDQTKAEFDRWREGRGSPPSYMVVTKKDGVYQLVTTPNGSPDRRFFEWTPAMEEEKTKEFTLKGVEQEYMQFMGEYDSAEQFYRKTGQPIPQELVDRKKGLEEQMNQLKGAPDAAASK